MPRTKQRRFAKPILLVGSKDCRSRLLDGSIESMSAGNAGGCPLALHRSCRTLAEDLMDLAIQNANAPGICRMYSNKEPGQGVCGRLCLKSNGWHIRNALHSSAKSQHKEASHVAIPIGRALKEIIDNSRDNVASPYVVHRLLEKKQSYEQGS
jgi:hypothetical protein